MWEDCASDRRAFAEDGSTERTQERKEPDGGPETAVVCFSATVRRAGRGDLDTLYALINLAYMRENWLLPAPRIFKRELAAELTDGANVFLVAQRDGEIAGTIRIRLEAGTGEAPPRPFFGLFAVAPQFQGLGLGRQLVAAAEDVARSSGFDAVHLQCARELGMCAYYEALDYGAVAESAGLHWSSLRPFTLVTMRKDLRGASETWVGGSHLTSARAAG